jgi:hypothetical protein
MTNGVDWALEDNCFALLSWLIVDTRSGTTVSAGVWGYIQREAYFELTGSPALHVPGWLGHIVPSSSSDMLCILRYLAMPTTEKLMLCGGGRCSPSLEDYWPTVRGRTVESIVYYIIVHYSRANCSRVTEKIRPWRGRRVEVVLNKFPD